MKTVYSFIIGLVILILGCLVFLISRAIIPSVTFIEDLVSGIPHVQLLSFVVMIASPVLFWLIIPINNKYHLFKMTRKERPKTIPEKQIPTHKAETGKGKTLLPEMKEKTIPPTKGELLKSAMKALELGDSKLAKEFVKHAKSMPEEARTISGKGPKPSAVREEIETMLKDAGRPPPVEEKFTAISAEEVVIEAAPPPPKDVGKAVKKRKVRVSKRPRFQICIHCGNKMPVDSFYCDRCGNFLRK